MNEMTVIMSLKRKQRINILNDKKIFVLIPLLIVLIILSDYPLTSVGLGLIPRLVTRFCYNSPDPSTVSVSKLILMNELITLKLLAF